MLRIDPEQIISEPDPQQMIEARVELAWGCSRRDPPPKIINPLRGAQLARSFSFWERVVLMPRLKDIETVVDANLGYDVLKHNNASKNWALNTVKGKRLVAWFTHGAWSNVSFFPELNPQHATDSEKPDQHFHMSFKDGYIFFGNLPSGLNANFVFMIACSSAWTGEDSREQSRLSNTVHQNVITFAEKFGNLQEHTTYVGFSWVERPVSAYNTARDLLEILAEGYTITEAIIAYENQSALPSGRLKGIGVDQKITIDSIIWENLENKQ